MGTGMARGAAKRGKRVAFGDGKRIIWDQNSRSIFHGNPNIATPGQEKASNLEWIPFYKGHRIYNKSAGDHWEWNMDFKPIRGQIFFVKQEKYFAERAHSEGFVVVEPNVPSWKSVAPNKQWPVERYDEVARRLKARGLQVVQFVYPKGSKHMIPDAKKINTPTFRFMAALLERAALYVGPEGGMHHAAAAVNTPGVVLFGGFIPTSVTGYDIHTNLGIGADACGSFTPCSHCKAAMAAISVEEVIAGVEKHMSMVAA